MDIIIIFARNFPALISHYSAIEKANDIYPWILQDQAVVVQHEEWTFICLNIEHCFSPDFTERLSQLSQAHELYMCAINGSVDGLWFEHYQKGQLTRQWIEVEGVVEGNMGAEYLPAEHVLGYPFADEAYENVGEEMIYELIYEITNFDITETF